MKKIYVGILARKIVVGWWTEKIRVDEKISSWKIGMKNFSWNPHVSSIIRQYFIHIHNYMYTNTKYCMSSTILPHHVAASDTMRYNFIVVP